MKLYIKLLILLVALTAAFGCVAVLIKSHSDRSVRLAKDDLQVSSGEVFDNLVELQRRSFVTFAEDYSWWQDLIDWIDSTDRSYGFLSDQFIQVPETFGANFFAIYDANGLRITDVLDSNIEVVASELLPLQLSAAIQNRTVSGWKQSAYLESNGDLVELIFAPIQPQKDELRNGPAFGYLAVGRFWNGDFIHELESVSGSTITINGETLHPDFHAERWTGSIHFSRQLNDFEGRITAKLDVSKDLPVADRIVNQQIGMFWWLLIVAIGCIVILVVSIMLMVSRPLNRLSEALEAGDTQALSLVRKSQPEFKHLAELIEENNEQKSRLEREISKRRRTESDLKQSRDLAESANRAKSRFLTNISHETRTPLHTISGYASLLQDSPLTEEQSQSVYYIRTSCDHLVKMLTDLIDLSGIEANAVLPELSGIDTQEFFYELLAAAESLAANKQITIKAELSQNCPEYIISDYARLRHILICLIDNAVKFTNEGSVTIRTTCESNETSTKLVIEIEDSGIGIASENLDRVFDAFFQADDSDSRSHEGGGLGLAVAKGMSKLLDAQLEVRSEPHEGSTFSLSIAQSLTDMDRASELAHAGVNISKSTASDS